MKLQKLFLEKIADNSCRNLSYVNFFKRIFGQNNLVGLEYAESFMSLSLPFGRKAAVWFCWSLLFALPSAVFAQTNYFGTNGTQYAIVGQLPGDQVWPDISARTNGGFVVWQDNATDGSGWGVSARKLDSTLSGTLSTFRVNATGTNDQQNARVAMLKNGGAVFTWQGGAEGFQHIYARFMTPALTFLTTTDILVSVPANNFQVNPAVAVLNNSNVVVVWSSFNEAGQNSLQDVYGQLFTQDGQKIGNEFLINQFTTYNQRTPSVAALANGGFVVVWVSEQQRTTVNGGNIDEVNGASPASIGLPSVDIYGRLYDAIGNPTSGEYLINAGFNPCANPAVATAADGSYLVAWTAHDIINVSNSFDIYARSFSGSTANGAVTLVNTNLYGDQYGPRISSVGNEFLVVWTSLAQDGSREGVYARYLHSGGAPVGGEFRVNTTTVSSQMHPVVASDGSGQFVAVWTSFTGSPYNFDLFAQRYISTAILLQPLSAPFVNAPFTLSNGVYQPQLQVAWSPVLGLSVSNYEVYVDGSGTPLRVTTSNCWTMAAANGLTTGSTHSFAVDYVLNDGRRSPISASTSGTTWSGCNWGGIPCEWMQAYFGNDQSKWPSATADSDGDGVNNLQEFLAGTIPTNAASMLTMHVMQTQQGMFLTWNTQPGLTYQVQMTTNFATWNNLGAPRFAAGTSDSMYVGGSPAAFYRILLQR